MNLQELLESIELDRKGELEDEKQPEVYICEKCNHIYIDLIKPSALQMIEYLKNKLKEEDIK